MTWFSALFLFLATLKAIMHRIITIPIQIILGLALMIWLALHFNIALVWLLFLGLVLCGSIIGSTPKQRRTAQTQDESPES